MWKHRKDLDTWNLGCWGGEGALCGRAAWGKGLRSKPTLERGKVQECCPRLHGTLGDGAKLRTQDLDSPWHREPLGNGKRCPPEGMQLGARGHAWQGKGAASQPPLAPWPGAPAQEHPALRSEGGALTAPSLLPTQAFLPQPTRSSLGRVGQVSWPFANSSPLCTALPQTLRALSLPFRPFLLQLLFLSGCQ